MLQQLKIIPYDFIVLMRHDFFSCMIAHEHDL